MDQRVRILPHVVSVREIDIANVQIFSTLLSNYKSMINATKTSKHISASTHIIDRGNWYHKSFVNFSFSFKNKANAHNNQVIVLKDSRNHWERFDWANSYQPYLTWRSPGNRWLCNSWQKFAQEFLLRTKVYLKVRAMINLVRFWNNR